MITPEQLAEIKHEMEKGDSLEPSFALGLIAMIERLTATLTAKDRVLSQFANWKNWSFLRVDCEACWIEGSNPIDLASQALGEGKE